MKYFLYARKSSEPEDRQMSSNEDQVIEMQRVAEEFNLTIVDIISEAKSAKRPGRFGFNQMLKRIENGEAEGILCWKLNRLARNPVDGGQISWLLQQRVIKHIQTNGRAYTPDDNVLMMQVEFGMANQFIKDLKVDVERGMKRKIERGWYPTNPPAGYLARGHNQRALNEPEIVPHPTQFLIIKKLWKLLLTAKYSIPGLKQEGDRLGLVKKDGTFYSKNAYYRLFSNIFYTGSFYWTPFNGIRTRYLGKHKPMISETEFKRAQDILHNRPNTRQRVNDFPYRGIIKCGECNGNVTAEQKLQAICTICKTKFSIITSQKCFRCGTNLTNMRHPTIIDKIYYRCVKKTVPTCSQKYLLKDVMEERILSELYSINISSQFYIWALSALKEISLKSNDNPETILLHRRKTELENRLLGLVKMRADNEIDKVQFEASKKTVEIEIQAIDKKIQSFDTLDGQLALSIKDTFDFSHFAAQHFKKKENNIKTQLLEKLGSNLVLQDKNLYITTENVFHCVKELESDYYVQFKRLERENNPVIKGHISVFHPCFLTLLTKLHAIRTCLENKILEEIRQKEEEDRELLRKYSGWN